MAEGVTNNTIKLLLATEAYGMGVDNPDIRRVIHAGPPCTLESRYGVGVGGVRLGLGSSGCMFDGNMNVVGGGDLNM